MKKYDCWGSQKCDCIKMGLEKCSGYIALFVFCWSKENQDSNTSCFIATNKNTTKQTLLIVSPCCGYVGVNLGQCRANLEGLFVVPIFVLYWPNALDITGSGPDFAHFKHMLRLCWGQSLANVGPIWRVCCANFSLYPPNAVDCGYNGPRAGLCPA